MEHILQTLEKTQNKYNKAYSRLIELTDNFLDKYDTPIGINIHTDKTEYGIILVTITPTRKLIEAKHYYDTKIHPKIIEELQLKLIKIEYTKTYYSNPSQTRYTRIRKTYKYIYTYKNNKKFTELKLEDTIM